MKSPGFVQFSFDFRFPTFSEGGGTKMKYNFFMVVRFYEWIVACIQHYPASLLGHVAQQSTVAYNSRYVYLVVPFLPEKN